MPCFPLVLLSLRLPLLRPEGGGTSFLRSGLVFRVRVCLLWCVVVVVGATAGRINLPQLYSHTGGVLHGGVSQLMASCASRSFRSAAWSSRRSSDLARFVSRRVAVIFCGGTGDGATWVLWSEDVGPEVLDLPLFPDFIGAMCGSWSKEARDVPGRHWRSFGWANPLPPAKLKNYDYPY
jgi:hypothetical protein